MRSLVYGFAGCDIILYQMPSRNSSRYLFKIHDGNCGQLLPSAGSDVVHDTMAVHVSSCDGSSCSVSVDGLPGWVSVPYCGTPELLKTYIRRLMRAPVSNGDKK